MKLAHSISKNNHCPMPYSSLSIVVAILTAFALLLAPVSGYRLLAQTDELRVFVPLVANSGPTASALPTEEERVVIAVYEHLNVLLTSDLYTMNPDGSDLIQITNAAEGTIHESPAWSPDGTRIAFAHYNRRGTERGIYVISADGSNLVRLTNSDGQGYDYAPSWSPDGSKIAFWSLRGGAGGTYIMNTDGTNLVQVPNIGQSIVNWSPDGTKFIFGAQPSTDVNFDIYTINIDGTNLARITETTNLLEDAPDWHP